MVLGFRAKQSSPKDGSVDPQVASPSTSVDSSTTQADTSTSEARQNATSSSSPGSSSPATPEPSWFARIAHYLGITKESRDQNTVYTTGVPGVFEVSVTPREHQRYVIGGYAQRNPDMMKPHRCNDRYEDFVLSFFYASSTSTPLKDFTYTIRMLYRCMSSHPGEEPSDPFKFLDEKAYHRRIKRAMEAYQAEFDRARSPAAGVREEKSYWNLGSGGGDKSA